MKYEYDIEITRGETYDNDIEIETAKGDAIDLTGKTAKAQIRPKEESDELSAEFYCTVNASENTIHLALTSQQTTSLQPGTYSYDVFLLGTGFRKCYIGGRFIVRGRTTIIEDETVTVSGSKTWDDSFDLDGIRPTSITINLLADGVQVDSVTVTEEDNWAWTFSGLTKYSGDREISYTITEDAIEGYTTVYDGYNVRNVHEVEEG